MNETEYRLHLEQIDRLAEIAELETDQGLTNESLDYAQFWANIDEVAA